MKIEIGHENTPMVVFPYELEMIAKSKNRCKLLFAWMYLQWMNNQCISDITMKTFMDAIGSNAKECMDELVDMGLLRRIVIQKETDVDDLGLPTSGYAVQHRFPEQIFNTEVHKFTVKEIIKEKRQAKERPQPSEVAFKLAERHIWYINDRYKENITASRYGIAISFESNMKQISDNPQNVLVTYDWYIKNYRNDRFLPVVRRISDLVYKYYSIREAMMKQTEKQDKVSL